MKTNTDNPIYYTANLGVDPQSGYILTSKERHRLGPINMAVLLTLIKRPGEVISRAEIFDSVWPNQQVSDDALTRCISDLRAQLGRFSDRAPLIETLPKRGYRWLPEVKLQTKETVSLKENSKGAVNRDSSQPLIAQTPVSALKDWLLSGLAGLLILLFISTSGLWLVDKLLTPEITAIALIPVKTSEPESKVTARQIDRLLSEGLLATDNLRFLSPSVVALSPENPYSYLSDELATRWVIEADIEGDIYGEKLARQLNLRLVDAHSALVLTSLSISLKGDTNNGSSNLRQQVAQFIAQVQSSLPNN